MAREFLFYWIPQAIARAVGRALHHAASDQFARVEAGDVLWICGRQPEYMLVTVGPLTVSELVRQAEAERRFGQRLRRTKYHAIAARKTVVRGCVVPLDTVLTRMRFVSESSRKLDLAKPIGSQLQTIRQLTEETSDLLWGLWYDDLSIPRMEGGGRTRR